LITGQQIYKHLGLKAHDSLPGVYVGWQQILCNWIEACGNTKVGRTINASSISRARSQGGADWWFDSYFILPDKEATYEVERIFKNTMKPYNFTVLEGKKLLQGQTELYYLYPWEATEKIKILLDGFKFDFKSRYPDFEIIDIVKEMTHLVIDEDGNKRRKLVGENEWIGVGYIENHPSYRYR
jgi:hypothetical protein